MIKSILYCSIYAVLNVLGAALIKLKLKGTELNCIRDWVGFLMSIQVIIAFVLIFTSALVMFKALSSASFTFTIPIATGINFALTIVAGYYLFKDQLNLLTFIGFGLILSGIVLLSINNIQNAQ